MSTTYVNPDAPNPEITDAAVRSMLMQQNGQSSMGGYGTSGYYPGATTNPFVGSQNVMSVPSGDSRANVGYPQMAPTQQMQQQYGYNPMQAGIAPPWNGGATFDQLTRMNQQALMGQGYPQMQQPVAGYNGYPIGIDPNNYIFEYMKNHTAPKNVWGENYWTSQRPIDQPPIDWTPKPQQTQYYDQYAQYGMSGVPCQAQQPALPPGFGFPQVQETWLDQAKKNWKNL